MEPIKNLKDVKVGDQFMCKHEFYRKMEWKLLTVGELNVYDKYVRMTYEIFHSDSELPLKRDCEGYITSYTRKEIKYLDYRINDARLLFARKDNKCPNEKLLYEVNPVLFNNAKSEDRVKFLINAISKPNFKLNFHIFKNMCYFLNEYTYDKY